MSSRSGVLIACALALAAAAVAAGEGSDAPDVEAGRRFAEDNCARCHAIGADGESPFKPAPPFRTFAHKWPLEYLEEALAEGIMVGHPAMPVFELTPREIDALTAYLASLSRP